MWDAKPNTLHRSVRRFFFFRICEFTEESLWKESSNNPGLEDTKTAGESLPIQSIVDGRTSIQSSSVALLCFDPASGAPMEGALSKVLGSIGCSRVVSNVIFGEPDKRTERKSLAAKNYLDKHGYQSLVVQKRSDWLMSKHIG